MTASTVHRLSPRRRWWPSAGIAALVSVSAAWWLYVALSAGPKPTAAEAALSTEPPTTAHGVPIEQIRLGMRVRGRNPALPEARRAAIEPVDPATWRAVSLRLVTADGATTEAQLLRPVRWVLARRVVAGGTVPLDLPEFGAVGRAEVVGVADCPPLADGDGAVVTGRFVHPGAHVLNLHLADIAEPIGVTAAHPFWSLDRRQFVPVSQLRRGERVRTLAGQARVASVKPRGPPETVYTLEVHGEHVFHVGPAGVLVHNASTAVAARPARRSTRAADGLPEMVYDYNDMPELADNIWHAQQAGHPDVLTHGGYDILNRRAALQDVPNLRPLSRDEYPFASSMQGGEGAWVGHVPVTQQGKQGRIISTFVRRNGIKPGDNYRVRVTNHPGDQP